MAYIPFSYAPMESDLRREFKYTLPLGGVKLSESGMISQEGKASDMFNMDVLEDGIETRGVMTEQTQGLYYDESSFHSITRNAFCGRLVVHSGTSLMTYSAGDSEVVLLYDGLPDRHSIMCEFMSKLYIYCDGRIFSVDNSFNLIEELPHAPLIFDDVNISGDAGVINEGFNVCAPIIRVKYRIFGMMERYIFRLPKEADTSKPFAVYINGNEINKSRYTFNPTNITFNYNLEYAHDVLELVYFLKNPAEIGYEFFIESCTVAESYGGNVNSGTRIFFTGNPNKKGYYCKSALQNPLYISNEEFEVIGDGCEDVTAMKKMYGDLIIFTKSTVYRMSYQLSSDMPYFTVREIGNGVGCDCPGSVCLIDNRVVFLNSEKGVFIVDSTEQTGEQNIKPISGNINYGNGRGLLENTSEKLKKCHALDYGRRYMLCAENKIYIWDYDKSAFRDSGNYAAAQGRLIWYIYTNIFSDILFELDGKLVTFSKSDFTFDVYKKESKNSISSGFSSGRLDITDASDKKHITEMNMLLYAYGNGKITFTFFADGQEYCKKQLSVTRGKRMHIKLRLPAKTLYSFSFDVLALSGVRIEKASFKYKIL